MHTYIRGSLHINVFRLGGFGFPELGVDDNFQVLTSCMDGERGKREIRYRRVTQTTLKV